MVRPRAWRAAAIAGGVVALALAAPGGAHAQITLTEGTNTVTTPRYEVNFGNSVGVAGGKGNIERVDSIRWRDSTGALSGNLASNGGPSSCGDDGPVEFFGQSYADSDGAPPGPVVAGTVGTWTPVGARTVVAESSTPSACSGANPVIPVRTRYSFFEGATRENTIRVERRWNFPPNGQSFGLNGLRSYVPRLGVGTYNQVLYPNSGKTAIVTDSFNGPARKTNWNGEWVALNSSGGNAGLLILRDPASIAANAAAVVTDYDGFSNANNSGVVLTPVVGQTSYWQNPRTEIEYLCFYDSTTWPVANRLNTLPAGCASALVPVNTDLPSVPSQDEGNPEPGNTYMADPGTWENRDTSVPFAYQWLRCDNSGCSDIPGATSQNYVATGDDLGKQLRVRVTATAVGGETDSATSILLGTLSGTVYRGSLSPGNIVAGARVEACQGTLQAPTDCRVTIANGSGVYRFIGLANGSYYVRAFPPSGDNSIPGTRSVNSVVSNGTATTGQDVFLRVPPPKIPGPVSFGGSGYRGTNPTGTPTIYWNQPVVIQVRHRSDLDVTGTITYPGQPPIPLTPGDPLPDPDRPPNPPSDPGGSITPFSVPPQFPNHGPADVDFDYTPDPDPDDPDDPDNPDDPDDPDDPDPDDDPDDDPNPFPLYIDPSGFVKTPAPESEPIVGATVTLKQAAFESGPFTVVPNGSDIMSPSNRTNPDTTDDIGHFGWDVIAGFYTVTASKPGCRNPAEPDDPDVTSQVYEIPPPVFDVDLRLDCSPLRVAFAGPTKLGKLKVPKSGAVKLPGVTATCPDGADAQCVVTLTVKKGKAKVGKGKVNVPVTETAPLAAKLTKKGLKSLKKAKKLNVKITASSSVADEGGEASQATYKAQLVPK